MCKKYMSLIKGIYAASMSVFNDDLTLNIDNTIKHAEMVIDNGCHGVASGCCWLRVYRPSCCWLPLVVVGRWLLTAVLGKQEYMLQHVNT